MINKRGQGLSTNAIVLIVLGVVVLAVLIIGFTLGWGSLKKYLGGGSNNVDTIAQACTTACSTNSIYDYCSVKRELNSDDETLKDVTCYYLSEKQAKYGIEKCQNICDNTVTLEACKTSDSGKVYQEFNTVTKTLNHVDCS